MLAIASVALLVATVQIAAPLHVAEPAGGLSGGAVLAVPEAPSRTAAQKGPRMSFELKSPAFTEGATIPQRFTCDGANVSPQLAWSGAPPATQSLVLIVDDPDAPSGTFTHWVLFDIRPERAVLAEGQKPGTLGIAGRNDFGNTGYGGPCPPRGHGAHRYHFTLSALDIATLGLTQGATRGDVEIKMKGHVLETARLMGKYERK